MSHPNLSGTWRFAPEKSALQIAAPDETVFVLVHDDPRLRLERTHRVGQERDRLALELSTDGRATFHERDGRRLVCRCAWEQDTLVFTTRVEQAGRAADNVVRYALSPDGDTLRAEERFRSPDLSYDNLWVLERVRQP